jgi:phosphohistidine phosphatase
MKLVLIRHGRAGTPAEFARSGMSDDLRPLTIDGRKRMRRGTEGLRRLLRSIDVIGNSPLVRAVETAQIVARVFGKVRTEELAHLAPGGDRDQLVRWLARQPAGSTVALVGHEPSLSELAGWLISGRGQSTVDLKKGGVCCIELGQKISGGTGRLQWLLTPRQMRQMRS